MATVAKIRSGKWKGIIPPTGWLQITWTFRLKWMLKTVLAAFMLPKLNVIN